MKIERRKTQPDKIMIKGITYTVDEKLTKLHKRKKPFNNKGLILLQVFETGGELPDRELIYVPVVAKAGN